MNPRMNDISTDLENPPQFHKIQELRPNKDYSYPERFIRMQQEHYPEIQPIRDYRDAQVAFNKALEKVKQHKEWKLVEADPKALRIEFVAVTPLMRYKDDVCIEVRPENEGCAIHMRSKSRLGRSDFGANAKRIKSFFKELLLTNSTN